MSKLNKRIDLSIVIPIYNVEEYLEECLLSVYEIKGITTEIILINDGSTDNSIRVINQFLKKYDDKTLFINQKNKGLSGARNVGIEKATGEYTLFIDSDDIITPEKVTFLVNYALKNRLDLVQTKSKTFAGKVNRELPVPSEMVKLPISNGRDYLLAYCNSASVEKGDFRPEAWLSLIKTEVFFRDNIRFQEGMYFEDELFTPNLILQCKRIKMLDLVFYHYRIRPNSIMTTSNERHIKSKAMLVAEYYQVIQKHKFYHPFLNCRLIGWTKEGLSYLSMKQLLVMLTLKKIKIKDFLLLVSLIIKKCFSIPFKTTTL